MERRNKMMVEWSIAGERWLPRKQSDKHRRNDGGERRQSEFEFGSGT